MKHKPFFRSIAVALAATMLLSACSGKQPADETQPAETTAATTGVNNNAISLKGLSGTYPYRPDPDIKTSVSVDENSAVLTAGGNRIEFKKDNEGRYCLTTYLLDGETWKPFFDAGKPVIQGYNFNTYPTTCELINDSDLVKTVKLTGVQEKNGYSFEIIAEVYQGNPLIHLRITIHLTEALTMSGREPTIALWKNGMPEDSVSFNQGTPNYQTVEDSVYWYSGFPAAFYYTDGLASAIYFDVTEMDWFSSGELDRFNKFQVRMIERNGLSGIGLEARNAMSGLSIPAGDMLVDMYIYGTALSESPTKLEALDMTVDAFSYCLASDSEMPVNYIDDEVSYEFYTQKIVEGLLSEGVSYSWNPPHVGSVWKDGPAITDLTVERILHRNGHISPSDPIVTHNGDWNCNNNCLIPLVLWERLHPNTLQKALIDESVPGLAAYFDDKAEIFRSFDVFEGYYGQGLEFTFQNYTMTYSTLWADLFMPLEDFLPELGGKYIMSMDGYRELAENTGYLQPQLIDVANKTAANSIDEVELGRVQEAWSGGFYAYCMCYAYEITGDEAYLEQAKRQMDILFEGLEFYVNDLKEKFYTDPYDFPVNEVNSVAYGVAACEWIYRFTGDKKYDDYAANIRNLTLRMMKWYESSLSSEPMDQALRSISFFQAFSKTDTTCPWETIHTYLPLTMELKNTDSEVSQAVLKAFNLFRKNALSFSGASWDPDVVAGAREYQQSVTAYYTPEAWYSLEIPTVPTIWGSNSYMSCSIMYAYLLFEGYAKATDEDILSVNLDLIDNSFGLSNGLERNFLLFNPTVEDKSFKLLLSDLTEDENYTVSIKDENGTDRVLHASGAELSQNGIELSLEGMRYCNLTVSLSEDSEEYLELTSAKAAQYALMIEYASVQSAALDGETVDTSDYYAALEHYRNGEYSYCVELLTK